jgi:hypothetical protein
VALNKTRFVANRYVLRNLTVHGENPKANSVTFSACKVSKSESGTAFSCGLLVFVLAFVGVVVKLH